MLPREMPIEECDRFPGQRQIQGRADAVPRTIAFLNQKGGVGKTSTVHHLGGTLASRGLKVLAVDADPQASLTQGSPWPRRCRRTLTHARRSPPSLTTRGAVQACDLVRPTGFTNLALLCWSEAAAALQR